jgi:hypothetical protein
MVKAFSGDVAGGVQGEDNSFSVLKKSRDLVSLFHSSRITTEKLISAQKHLKPNCTTIKLLQDVKTRWWSTHSLISRI